MEIPYQELQADTLRSLIEEFVSREGTDYGVQIYDLNTKVLHVMKQLEQGKAFIDYDAESYSCNLILRGNG
tara:strand:+ start:997 stop:1209 length:213 start_codon:yes stop_codon:yes gene_type:complete